MVVLELGGLEDRPSLLVAVMFSLIIYIENRMYRTPRNLKKLNVIDEGWRLLDFKNHKVGEFIEKGYRTARRHTGAYITITQNIVDFDSDKAAGVCWTSKITRSVSLLRKVTVPPAVIPVPISPSHRTSSTLTLTRPPVLPARHGVTPPTKLSSNRVRRSSRNTTSCIRTSSCHCSVT